MKLKFEILSGFLLLMSATFLLPACEKIYSNEESSGAGNTPLYTVPVKDSTTSSTLNQPYPEMSANVTCDYAPDYGDSIVYPEPFAGNNYYITPVNNSGIDGTYMAWPDGLSLNTKTGAINLSASETGARYDVAFVRSGTTDTCMSHLIVAGAAYMDSIYVMSGSDTTSRPYFNANYFGTSPCNGSSGGQGCKFDYNNSAKNQGIEIDQHTGYIDLKKTMKHNPFGPFPINGTSLYVTVYYKINDASNNAAQRIQLQLMYFNKKADVPPAMSAQIGSNVNNTQSGVLLSKGATPRPPLIVITRVN